MLCSIIIYGFCSIACVMKPILIFNLFFTAYAWGCSLSEVFYFFNKFLSIKKYLLYNYFITFFCAIK